MCARQVTIDTGNGAVQFRLCDGALQFAAVASRLRMEDCYSHVSPGYAVVRSNCSFHCAGRAEVMDWPGCGRREQRGDLHHWSADGAVWIYSGQFVLHRRVRREYPVVDAGAASCVHHGEHREQREAELRELRKLRFSHPKSSRGFQKAVSCGGLFPRPKGRGFCPVRLVRRKRTRSGQALCCFAAPDARLLRVARSEPPVKAVFALILHRFWGGRKGVFAW
jgi:hypothetical protein